MSLDPNHAVEVSLQVVTNPTPAQRAAWARLFTILLAPVESQSAGAGNESMASPETAIPLQRQPKRPNAGEPSRRRKQERLRSHPEPSDGPR
jgi:hypothetical protein